MKIFKNRIAIGIACIVAALAISFGVAPLASRIMDARVEVVRVRSEIKEGWQITEDNLEVVKVGGFNLQSGIITDKAELVGRYAATNLYIGDFITKDKLTDLNASCDNVLASVDVKKAISITVPSYAAGLSGKLNNGDIVSVVVYKDGETFVPENLRSVRVITTTTSEGVDRDETEEEIKPVSITFLVSMEQAKDLVLYENSGKMHVVLMRRDPYWNQNYLVQEDIKEIWPEEELLENVGGEVIE